MSREQIKRAFEQLLEHVEGDVNGLQEEGARQLRFGNYDSARDVIREAERVASFRKKIKALQNEWVRLDYRPRPGGDRHAADSATFSGERTPEEAFRRPILESIHQKGGQASLEEVLSDIQQKFEALLNDYDKLPLPGMPERTRWQNTVIWCRNALIEEEYLTPHPTTGMLELTPKGQTALSKEGDIPRAEPQVSNGPAPLSEKKSPQNTVRRF